MVGRTNLNVTLYIHCLYHHSCVICGRENTILRNPDLYLRRISAWGIYTASNKGSGNNQTLLSILDIRFVEDF